VQTKQVIQHITSFIYRRPVHFNANYDSMDKILHVLELIADYCSPRRTETEHAPRGLVA
jgi:hypothetical protein